ncbi:S-adenosylmethionine:tRNA ribosyltransferase-isomerase [Acetobacter malorum]|uniref:S-adenosylmethionine:tRNA ribosyltransferase-isomerase n=1 Tax=Acetobacter malorum TaxID=178901 RepID=A0A177GCB6_9PROT|nr:S-adenosylmethionine:tRNA ribosyltransferase-isomerase [Acetobacter malorum]
MSDRTEDFDFHLPETLIAQEPARPREAARLLDVPAHGPFMDRHVSDLPSLLKAGDLLVANDTAVIRAQLHGLRGEAHIGITLDRILPDTSWHVLVRNARRLKVGDTLTFTGSPHTATVLAREEGGGAILRFSAEGSAFDTFLQDVGALALPPYIHRPDGPTAQDAKDYATIFAEHKGAVAAPTAGLHFTPTLLEAVDATGAERCTLTLHVGCWHLPACARKRHFQTSHARRARHHHAGNSGAHQCCPSGRGPHYCGRHHKPAPAGKCGR